MNLVIGGFLGGNIAIGGFDFAAVLAQQTFRQALTAKLESIPELVAIVGSAIYPGMLPETHDLERDGPALSYAIQSGPCGSVLSGSDGTQTMRVQFSAWSYNLSDSEPMTNLLFNAIDGLFNDSTWGNGTVVIMSVSQADELDITEQMSTGTDIWMHQIPSEYTIKYRIPNPTLN